MRSRPALSLFVVTVVIGGAWFPLACSTGSSKPQDPADGAPSAAPTTALPSAEAVAADRSAPVTFRGPMGEITNLPPDGGVVMDNATPPGSNAAPTRLQPIIDVISKNREKFRACFDTWGSANPGRELKVTLTIKLDKAGGLTSAAFKPDETGVVDKPMETCMASAAKSLEFPASPNGRDTRYNHRFVFKAKKS